MHNSDKGSRFFDRVLAQRLTQSSPTRTCDRGCLSPSLMHLDDGEVDHVSHVRVPAATVQSYAPSDDLSGCAGHAAAVSSQRSSVPGRDDSTEGCSNPMGHVSSVPSTWCVGYFLAWLNRSSWVNRRFDGRHLGVVQKPATHRVSGRSTKTVQSARFRASLPDAKRPSRVSSCQKSAIRCPTPAAEPSPKRMTNSASLGKLVRVVARNN